MKKKSIIALPQDNLTSQSLVTCFELPHLLHSPFNYGSFSWCTLFEIFEIIEFIVLIVHCKWIWCTVHLTTVVFLTFFNILFINRGIFSAHSLISYSLKQDSLLISDVVVISINWKKFLFDKNKGLCGTEKSTSFPPEDLTNNICKLKNNVRRFWFLFYVVQIEG